MDGEFLAVEASVAAIHPAKGRPVKRGRQYSVEKSRLLPHVRSEERDKLCRLLAQKLGV